MALPPAAARRHHVLSRLRGHHRYYLAVALVTVTLLAASIALVLARPWFASPSAPQGLIVLRSEPGGARVESDGRGLGVTPARLELSAGEHRLDLRLEGYIPTSITALVEENAVTAIDTQLWLGTARVQRLRPVFPGSVVTNASFLSDGVVALSLSLPSARGQELWVVDPSGRAERLGTVGVRGSVAATSDGKQVAYLAGMAHANVGAERLDEAWVAAADGGGLRKLYELPSTATDYRLSDLSWIPDGKQVLLVSSEQASGESSSTHFVSLDVGTGATEEVLAIPSDVVEGSLAWSPNGKHVAFLTRSGGTGGSAISLCLLDVSTGDFRYLADLGRDDQGSLPFVPLSWSPDGQSFVYSAPEEGATQSPSLSLSLLGGKPPQVLYRSDVSKPRSERIGAAEGQFPIWRSDGQLLALAPPNGGGPLVVRAIDSSGRTTDVGQVPLRVQGSYSVLWDAPHAQALIAFHNPNDLGSSSTELWWLHFRPEVDR